MIQQMAEVEAVKQMSEAEEQARTQKLLAMPEKDKCERKKCRVMRGVHQDILQREGCSRCLAGKPCKRCKKIFQTDISPEEKAKRAARLRSDSSDSCSTEEALAEDNLTEEALAEEMDKLLGEIDEMRMDTLLFV
jgi:vacuolar-type H+-ATPase catalytic subunit A/Vma1